MLINSRDNYLKLALIAKLSSVVLNCLSAMFSAKQPVPLGSYLLSLQLFSYESPTWKFQKLKLQKNKNNKKRACKFLNKHFLESFGWFLTLKIDFEIRFLHFLTAILPFNKSHVKINAIFMPFLCHYDFCAIFVISKVRASIWNVFIKFHWHGAKLTIESGLFSALNVWHLGHDLWRYDRELPGAPYGLDIQVFPEPNFLWSCYSCLQN